MRMWSNSCKNITTLSCLRVSRCGDLRSTWETCGFGIQSCWACQRCWSDVRCWHPSCSPLRARCHQAPAPGPQKVRAKWTNGGEGQFWRDSVGPHHIRSPSLPVWDICILCMVTTRSRQHQLRWGGTDWVAELKGCVYRKQCKSPWQIQVIYVCLVKKFMFWNTQGENQRLDNRS